MKKLSFIVLISAVPTLYMSGCWFSGFTPRYEIPSPSGNYVALIGSRFVGHHLMIKQDGETMFDEEIFFDDIETGIADVRWKADESAFAVKVCGYADWKMAKIYDLTKDAVEMYEEEDLSRVPPWTRFDTTWAFNDQLDQYRVGSGEQ